MEYSYVEVQSVIHLTTDPGIQILLYQIYCYN